MKIKKLEELDPKELLIFGIIFIFIGFTFENLLGSKKVVIEILFIIIIFTGLIFFAAGVGKLMKGLEQQKKIKILREKKTEIKNFKKFIYFIIPFIISLLVVYWFEIRPNQIRQNCFKEASMVEIDFFSTSSEKNIMGKKYQECLKRHNLEK